MWLWCRCVPAGDASGRTGTARWCPICSWRTTNGTRSPGCPVGEGDPQLRAGRHGRPRRAGPAGVLDLAVPRPRSRPIAAAAGGEVEVLDSRRLGGGVDAGPAVGAARDRRGDPPGRRRAAPGRRRGRAGAVRAGRAAGAGTGLEAGRDRLGRPSGSRSPAAPGFTDDAAYRGDGLPARRAGRDRRARSSPRSRTCSTWIWTSSSSTPPPPTGRPSPPTSWPSWPTEPRPTTSTSSPVEAGRAAFGHSKDHRDRPAAGGDRDGGHPRRDPGAVLDLPRQHRRHRDHPHGQGRPGRRGTCAGWCGSPTAGSPPPPTAPT